MYTFYSMLGSVFCILYRCLDCTWEQLLIHWVMIVLIALSVNFGSKTDEKSLSEPTTKAIFLLV